MAEQLRFPHRVYFVHSFQFTNNNIFDKDIQPQPFIKEKSIIGDRDVKLASISQPSLGKLMAKTNFVYPFQ